MITFLMLCIMFAIWKKYGRMFILMFITPNDMQAEEVYQSIIMMLLLAMISILCVHNFFLGELPTDINQYLHYRLDFK